MNVIKGSLIEALPVLARLYGATEADLADLASQLTAAWIVQDGDEVRGAVGLRPSPAHGAEIVGGAFPGPHQHGAALALLRAAMGSGERLYAYGEADFLPPNALDEAGWPIVGAYARLTGPLPDLAPETPDGFTIQPIAGVLPGHLLAAQRFYSDRIGHTAVPDEAAGADAFGTDSALGRIALDADGQPTGLCRAALDGDTLSLTTPAIRPDLRGGPLRGTLLRAVLRAGQGAGAQQVIILTWGDTPQERADDLALGLTLDAETPIYASAAGEDAILAP